MQTLCCVQNEPDLIMVSDVDVGRGPGMLAFELAYQVATRVSSLVLAATIKMADGYY